jgi:amidase
MESGIIDVCTAGLARLAHLGCTVEPARFAMSPGEVWEAWLVWRHFLVSAGLGPLAADPARRTKVKPEALWEIERGVALTGADIARAGAARSSFHSAIVSLFSRFDALAIPTAQVWPFPVEERWPQRIGDREMDTYHRWMEVTAYATFAGLPAISVPVGFDGRGLPMGMQLIGPPRADVDVLRLAYAYEQTIADFAVGARAIGAA